MTLVVACLNRLTGRQAGHAKAPDRDGARVQRLRAWPLVATRQCDLAERGRTVLSMAMHNPPVTRSVLVVTPVCGQLRRPRRSRAHAVDQPRPEDAAPSGSRPARTLTAEATGIPEAPTITSARPGTRSKGGNGGTNW